MSAILGCSCACAYLQLENNGFLFSLENLKPVSLIEDSKSKRHWQGNLRSVIYKFSILQLRRAFRRMVIEAIGDNSAHSENSDALFSPSASSLFCSLCIYQTKNSIKTSKTDTLISSTLPAPSSFLEIFDSFVFNHCLSKQCKIPMLYQSNSQVLRSKLADIIGGKTLIPCRLVSWVQYSLWQVPSELQLWFPTATI